MTVREAVERAERLRTAKDRLKNLDGDPEVMKRAGLVVVAHEHVQLRGPEPEPLHRNAEVRRVQELGVEQLDIEPHGLVEVLRVDADMVDPARAHGPFIPGGPAKRAMTR